MLGVVASGDVADGPVALLGQRRDTQAEGTSGQRGGQRGAGTHRGSRRDLQRAEAGEAQARQARTDVDDASLGKAPIQRALRSAQHLDALDVHQARGVAEEVVERHVVDEDRRSRVPRARAVAQAADGQVAQRPGAQRVVELQVRHGSRQVLERADAPGLDRLAIEHGDRIGSLGQRLGALAGGDDHCFHGLGRCSAWGGCSLRHRDGREGVCNHEDDGFEGESHEDLRWV